MSDDNQMAAEATAQQSTTSEPAESTATSNPSANIDQAEQNNAAANLENMTEEERAAYDEQQAKAAQERNERTKKRREQRRKAESRREREARIKAENEAAYYRGLAEGQQRAGSQGQAAQQQNPRPQFADYQTQEDYEDALADWQYEQRQAKKQQQNQQGQSEQAGNQQQQSNQPQQQGQAQQIKPELQQSLQNFHTKGLAAHGDDFNMMIQAAQSGEFATNEVMLDSMLEADNGPDIAMYLFDNPEEADKISRMSVRGQVKAMDDLSKQLGGSGQQNNQGIASNNQQGQNQPFNNSISNAPAPITPGKTTSVASTALDKLPMDEYIKRRQKMLLGNK